MNGFRPDIHTRLESLFGHGQLRFDVPEVRYDQHGTATYYERPERYRGLLAHEASALSDALYHDLGERVCLSTGALLPPSPCLLTLRTRWALQSRLDVEDDEPTLVSGRAPCCDGECHGPWDCEEYGSRNED